MEAMTSLRARKLKISSVSRNGNKDRYAARISSASPSLQLKASPFRAGMANSYKLPKALIIFGGALCLRVVRGC
jgi:hypothetical protein